MSSLWPDPPAGPEPASPTLTLDGPEHAPDAASWTTDAQAVSPEIRDLVEGGFVSTYGPAWRPDYGTTVGRALTGASPEEALPPAGTPQQDAVRSRLVGALSSQHPETDAALRGALADTMPQAERAVVNGAALEAVVARDPEALLDFPPDVPRDQPRSVACPGRQGAPVAPSALDGGAPAPLCTLRP